MSTEAISSTLSAPTAPATTPAPERRPGSSGAWRWATSTRRPPRWPLPAVGAASRRRRVGRRRGRVHGGGGRGARPPLCRRLGRPGPARCRAAGRRHRGRLRRLRQPRRELRQLGGGRISAAAEPGPTLVFPTAGEAAAGTTVTVPTILDTSDPVLHLLRRTTFGLTPELVVECTPPASTPGSQPSSSPRRCPIRRATQRGPPSPCRPIRPRSGRRCPQGSDAAHAFGNATLAQQMWSSRQLFEVVVDSGPTTSTPTPGPRSWDVGAYHRDVIRPRAGLVRRHARGRGRHPAMLRYLTADRSKKDSVNENYGRELLELHTVGVASGYTEQDVRNSAHVLTGRTVVSEEGHADEGTFRYDPEMHWVGPVTVLDFSHPNPTPEGGLDVGDAYLRHLAGTPPPPGPSRPSSPCGSCPTCRLRRWSTASPRRTSRPGRPSSRCSTSCSVRRVLGGGRAEDPPARRERGRHARILGTVPEGDPVRSIAGLANVALRAGHKAIAWPAPNGYPDVNAAALGHGPPHLLEPASHADRRLGGRSLPSRPRGHGRRGHADRMRSSTTSVPAPASRRSSPPIATHWWPSSGATRPPRSGTTWRAPPRPRAPRPRPRLRP